ncbi:MAG: hypothetical protein JWO47_987 [Candidatus Saccharibacteria bacterium]|nr:hypothetical protein [Candidatus Saccharibacteria bacterium]
MTNSNEANPHAELPANGIPAPLAEGSGLPPIIPEALPAPTFITEPPAPETLALAAPEASEDQTAPAEVAGDRVAAPGQVMTDARPVISSAELNKQLDKSLRGVKLSKDQEKVIKNIKLTYSDILDLLFKNVATGEIDEVELGDATKKAQADYKTSVLDKAKNEKTEQFKKDSAQAGEEFMAANAGVIEAKADEVDSANFALESEAEKTLRLTEIKDVLTEHLRTHYQEGAEGLDAKIKDLLDAHSIVIDGKITTAIKQQAVARFVQEINYGKPGDKEDKGLQGILTELSKPANQSVGRLGRFIVNSGTAPDVKKIGKDEADNTQNGGGTSALLQKIEGLLETRHKYSDNEVADIMVQILVQQNPEPILDLESVNTEVQGNLHDMESGLLEAAFSNDAVNHLLLKRIRPTLHSQGLIGRGRHAPTPAQPTEAQPVAAIQEAAAAVNKYAPVAQISAQLPVLERITLAKSIKEYIDRGENLELLQTVVDMVADLDPTSPDRAAIAQAILGY